SQPGHDDRVIIGEDDSDDCFGPLAILAHEGPPHLGVGTYPAGTNSRNQGIAHRSGDRCGL
ncbi:MAG: hypothetical protein ABI776_07695, partial [Nocardioidaceae bacterium]